MNKSTSRIQQVYQQLHDWLEDTQAHEIRSVVELIEQAKAYAVAAEQIPAQKLQQFMANLKYDLSDFYQQYQADIKHSLYLEVLNESLWASLSQITDRSQVEWSELMDDFQHQDGYHVGDYVGFGQLQCQNCQHNISYYHASVVAECIACGGKDFYRLSLTP
ncbi:Zinc-ribbon containing domain-containing protein [Colwellia chukchiensis]|uniref:Zinc-ribbon containing domain-containing protein n=1 Tax=Colwellia chukchiensis TaxID=641665 RepID=A0A1H7H1U1_9GAMM|nr:zinc ribbon-containing protein [Colwellia chukchiensis]SEK44386.1 Zinc-ribbon containing domain-containing protein [Colwellia chukchiensis]